MSAERVLNSTNLDLEFVQVVDTAFGLVNLEGMLRVKKLQQEIVGMSVEEFVEAHPYSVIVARKMLGGFIKQKNEDMLKQTMQMPQQAGGGTMLHVEAMVEPGEAEKMDPGDAELAETRVIAREFVFPLKKKDGTQGPITIGRSNSCDIVINDYTISKRHAMFVWDPRVNRAVFADAGSTNGTAVGTRSLKIGERCALQSGYWITLGRMLCQFYTASDFYKYLHLTK